MHTMSPMPTTDSTPHPRWIRLRNTFLIGVGCSVALALIQSINVYWFRMAQPNPRFGWLLTFALTLPSWLVIAVAAPVVVAAARRYSFEPRNRLASVAVHLGLSVSFGLAHLAVMSATYALARANPVTWDVLQRYFGVAFRYLFLWEILSYWAIVGIYFGIHSSNARRRLAEAQLSTLRAQLNPHFLFNAMNAISTLALRGDHAAVVETIGRLSDLLRASLDGEAEEVTLAQEVEFFDSYMAIQRVRFQDRLCVKQSFDPDTLHSLVPYMMLQPIVENAVKYGINAKREAGTISVSAVRHRNSLLIEVQDDGPGFPPGGPREGIGLGNTRARLEALYGGSHRFELSTSPDGGASVRITIPFREGAA